VVWCVATTLAAVFASSLPLFLICQVASIWLIRSLYFHGSIVTALADLGLARLALAFAIWAARSSGSVFTSIWCFFLVQALSVRCPANIGAKALGHRGLGPTIQTRRTQRNGGHQTPLAANANHNVNHS
jgi:hypothetical protein